ncbi:MAG: uracil-DNA glycosylase [Candidatus Doudnabacteria bacterium]|nr:uracil-DNA glycosylase [Candidatus Doudnabacteria bacterium]
MSLASTKKSKLLKQISDEVWGLTASPLYGYRTQHQYCPVLGEGSQNARVVFVGEAPGEKEAQTGRPFAGAAGKVLDKLLTAAGLPRGEVFIGNLVKDRPPDNRDPLPEEVALYGPFLIRQLNVIQPKVIATLGRISLQYVLRYYGAAEYGQTISVLHGKPIALTMDWGSAVLMPLYHPAAALYNPKLRPALEADFKLLRSFIDLK